MVKAVAVTPSASTSVHEMVREVADVETRATDSTSVERAVQDDSYSNAESYISAVIKHNPTQVRMYATSMSCMYVNVNGASNCNTADLTISLYGSG